MVGHVDPQAPDARVTSFRPRIVNPDVSLESLAHAVVHTQGNFDFAVSDYQTKGLPHSNGDTIEAQRRTIAPVEFLIDKTKLLDRLKDQLNARQEKAPDLGLAFHRASSRQSEETESPNSDGQGD